MDILCIPGGQLDILWFLPSILSLSFISSTWTKTEEESQQEKKKNTVVSPPSNERLCATILLEKRLTQFRGYRGDIGRMFYGEMTFAVLWLAVWLLPLQISNFLVIVASWFYIKRNISFASFFLLIS